MNLGELRQVILYVQNMASQVEFYRDTLGIMISFPHVEDYTEEDWVAFNTGSTTLALHSGGNKRLGEDAPKFTFEVQNVEQTREKFIAKGIKVGQIVESYPGSYVCSAQDPEGNYFYFQSYP